MTGLALRSLARSRNTPFAAPATRNFHISSRSSLPRRTRPSINENLSGLHAYSANELADEALESIEQPFENDDTSSAGHLMYRQQRQILFYLRLIEHEMPKLVAYRKPFIPPTPSTPSIMRSVDYAGEEHPATMKRAIVVPVAHLSLRGEDAIHNIKLLAGPRWTPDPPADSGVGRNEAGGEHGYIKIACEDFPQPAMNLKWASDTLDRLISEADKSKETFLDVPLDTRHVEAKALKAKKGEHLRNRVGHRPTLKDFPKDWLPTPKETPPVSDSQ